MANCLGYVLTRKASSRCAMKMENQSASKPSCCPRNMRQKSYDTLVEAVREEIIKPVLPSHWLSPQTRYLINPTGRFVIGGPLGDCGLTGRKIIVDTYGGMARHGGVFPVKILLKSIAQPRMQPAMWQAYCLLD